MRRLKRVLWRFLNKQKSKEKLIVVQGIVVGVSV